MAYVLEKIIPFSPENREYMGGVAAYDTALGNRLGRTSATTISKLIEVVIGEKPTGDFDTVMTRFENALNDHIEAGKNVTDLNLIVCPYIPGIGIDPIRPEMPE